MNLLRFQCMHTHDFLIQVPDAKAVVETGFLGTTTDLTVRHIEYIKQLRSELL